MTDMPTPRSLEQRAYNMLSHISGKAEGTVGQVHATLMARSLEVSIAQAYIDLARNLRTGAPRVG
jgi:hypothetical protein